MVGFLLHDGGAIHGALTMRDITYLELNEVTAARDGQDAQMSSDFFRGEEGLGGFECIGRHV
jgi:hypothetical protein